MLRPTTPVPPPDYARSTLGPEHIDALMPRHRIWMTWLLIAAIVLTFAAQVYIPGFTERYYDAPDLVRAGEWWRVLTSGLLHGGILHLGANAYFGWYIGARLERYIGAWRLLAISLVAQVGCGVAVLFGSVPALGFSGVLYGWLAAWLAFHLTPRYPGLRLTGPMLRAYLQTLVANLAISLIPGVSLLGHVGGFIGGFVVAFAFGSVPRRVTPSVGGGTTTWTGYGGEPRA